jgi:hypothetical protein
MSRQRTAHEADVRLERIKSRADIVRRTRRQLLDADKEGVRENRARARELRALKSTYRRDLAALMGSGDMRRYRDLRKKLSRASRSKRIRETTSLLDEIGFDWQRAGRLQNAYLDDARKLLAVDGGRFPRPPIGPAKSPWVTYSPPYSGDSWSYQWDRSDEASDPVFARHLDRGTGRIGSSIKTQLSGADDDDFLNAYYYTALNVWHTALATGPLEGYVTFEFNASSYSGQVKDESGFSDATYNQWARARFRVLDSAGVMDAQESRIFSFAGTDWGDGASWNNYVAKPRDLHSYYFRTNESFSQGSLLVVEAGVWNVTWFLSNDESITTSDDLDLRLDSLRVRSLPS